MAVIGLRRKPPQVFRVRSSYSDSTGRGIGRIRSVLFNPSSLQECCQSNLISSHVLSNSNALAVLKIPKTIPELIQSDLEIIPRFWSHLWLSHGEKMHYLQVPSGCNHIWKHIWQTFFHSGAIFKSNAIDFHLTLLAVLLFWMIGRQRTIVPSSTGDFDLNCNGEFNAKAKSENLACP